MSNATFAFEPSLTSSLLGLSIAVFTIPGWLANLLLLIVISYGGLLNSRSIYVLMASLAVGDFVILSLLLFYLAPSSVAQDWLLPPELIYLPGDLLLICWYNGWFMISTIGVNRYVAVCHSADYPIMFTQQRAKYIVAFSWIAAVVIWTHFLWMPCCRFLVTFITYSFMWDMKSEINYGDLFVEWPGNAGTSTIVAFCYAKVVREIYKTSNMVQDNWANNQASNSNAQEKRLALQFLFISSVYTATWAMFRICPIIFGTDMLELYIIVAYLLIINCSVNPFLYFKYTTEIKEKLAELRGIGGTQALHVVAVSHSHRNDDMELKDLE